MKKTSLTTCLALGLGTLLAGACTDAAAQMGDGTPASARSAPATRPFLGAGFTVNVPQTWEAVTVRDSMFVIAPRGKMLVSDGHAWMERGIFAYSYTLAGDAASRSLGDVTTALVPRLVRSGDTLIAPPKLVDFYDRAWGLFIVKQPRIGGESKPSIAFHFVQKQAAVVTVLVAAVYADSSMEAAATLEAEPGRAFDQIISSLRIDQAGPTPVALNLPASAPRPAASGAAGTYSGQHSPQVQLYLNAIEAAADSVRYAPYPHVP